MADLMLIAMGLYLAG
ncbi:hypothetical protein MKD33_14145, partial [Chromobacterium piscinae]